MLGFFVFMLYLCKVIKIKLMEKYLGKFPIEISETEYKDYTPNDWALEYISSYGGIDGAHHKDWVLDQVSRILHGTPIVIEEARWSNGQKELRFCTGEPTKEYLEWVLELRGIDEDGEYEYDYEEGIAP